MIIDLKDIIKSLKKLRTDEKIKVSDEILFQESVRIFNTRFIQENKKNYQGNKQNNSSDSATDKQKDLLYKLDVDFNAETISKQEAKQLISKNLKNKNV